jgi:hypothetical protein
VTSLPKLIDIFGAGLTGELRVHVGREPAQFLLISRRGSFRLLARAQQIFLCDVELVGYNLEIALQLLILLVRLGQTLREGIVLLLQRCLGGLLDILRTVPGGHAEANSEQRNPTEHGNSETYPAGRCRCVISIGFQKLAHKLLSPCGRIRPLVRVAAVEEPKLSSAVRRS